MGSRDSTPGNIPSGIGSRVAKRYLYTRVHRSLSQQLKHGMTRVSRLMKRFTKRGASTHRDVIRPSGGATLTLLQHGANLEHTVSREASRAEKEAMIALTGGPGRDQIHRDRN